MIQLRKPATRAQRLKRYLEQVSKPCDQAAIIALADAYNLHARCGRIIRDRAWHRDDVTEEQLGAAAEHLRAAEADLVRMTGAPTAAQAIGEIRHALGWTRSVIDFAGGAAGTKR